MPPHLFDPSDPCCDRVELSKNPSVTPSPEAPEYDDDVIFEHFPEESPKEDDLWTDKMFLYPWVMIYNYSRFSKPMETCRQGVVVFETAFEQRFCVPWSSKALGYINTIQ